MTIRLLATLLVASFVGCSGSSQATRRARKYVENWDRMEMQLPADQVPFFAEHFPEVRSVLADALTHQSDKTRMRAAYVVEELGTQATDLEPELLRSLGSESERLVRLYIYGALRGIGAQDQETIVALRDRFRSLGAEAETAPAENTYYTRVDERMKVAAVLYVLDKGSEQSPDYLRTVLRWLHPPEAGASGEELEAYWNHRWCAVIDVEHMYGATEAIPLLEAMLDEKPSKSWVSVHVPRALEALRSSRP